MDNSIKTYLSFASAVIALSIAGAMIALAVVRSSPPAAEALAIAPGGVTNHPVHIRPLAGPPTVETGDLDFHGHAVTVACSTCHATGTPNTRTRNASDLKDFHQGLKYNHGHLSCLSCHNADNYDTLRLADGSPVAFQDAMKLCAQCHGPQTRDFHNGSHGGMTGFWDLAKGARTRNNCLDCHDAHAPQFPTMMPVFPPAPTGKSGSNKH